MKPRKNGKRKLLQREINKLRMNKNGTNIQRK